MESTSFLHTCIATYKTSTGIKKDELGMLSGIKLVSLGESVQVSGKENILKYAAGTWQLKQIFCFPH